MVHAYVRVRFIYVSKTVFNCAQEPESQEPEEIPETKIEVDIPKVNVNLGKGVHFVKLPNFLSVETR